MKCCAVLATQKVYIRSCEEVTKPFSLSGWHGLTKFFPNSTFHSNSYTRLPSQSSTEDCTIGAEHSLVSNWVQSSLPISLLRTQRHRRAPSQLGVLEEWPSSWFPVRFPLLSFVSHHSLPGSTLTLQTLIKSVTKLASVFPQIEQIKS